VHEVRELLAEIALTLKKPANSFDKLAEKLIKQE
jgi:hypothetical protein